MGWLCPHRRKEYCKRTAKRCEPAKAGCVLYGRLERIEDDDSGRDGSDRDSADS